MQDVGAHFVGINELEAWGGIAPHMLKLKPFRLEQGVDQIECIELDASTVNLSKDIADFVNIELLVELDI